MRMAFLTALLLLPLDALMLRPAYVLIGQARHCTRPACGASENPRQAHRAHAVCRQQESDDDDLPQIFKLTSDNAGYIAVIAVLWHVAAPATFYVSAFIAALLAVFVVSSAVASFERDQGSL